MRLRIPRILHTKGILVHSFIFISLVFGSASSPAQGLAEDRSRRLELDYNHFVPLRQNKDVLAARFHAGLGLGDWGIYFQIGEAF